MSLEPLADYLKPRFGNVYDFDDLDGAQPWTPGLRKAVKQYLTTQADAELYPLFLEYLESGAPTGTRGAQADFIVAHNEAWRIAYAFHKAAVATISTLGELLEAEDEWSSPQVQEDAEIWLESHLNDQQITELALLAGHSEVCPPQFSARKPDAFGLVQTLSPAELLAAWHKYLRGSLGDLNDDEWRPLVPLLRQLKLARTDSELTAARRFLNAVHYKFAHSSPWSRLPDWYGRYDSIYARYRAWLSADIFRRLAELVEGNSSPAAATLVEWLHTLPVSADDHHDISDVDQEFSAEAVRAWARANGHTVGRRGRLPTTLVERYRAAAYPKPGGGEFHA